MPDIIEVSEAVAERLKPVLLDWNVLWFEPSPIPVPAVCIEGDPSKAADYTGTWGDFTKWYLKISLFFSANDQEAAVRRLGSLTGTSGPLLRALRDEDAEDALAQMSRGVVEATTLTGWQMIRRNRDRYRAAVLNVTVATN